MTSTIGILIVLALFAVSDMVTVLFGSLGGIAAVVVALNTWLIRKEAARAKLEETNRSTRMDTFELSQSSLKEALTRSDHENNLLRQRLAAQDIEMATLRAEISTLRRQVEEFARDKR